MRFVRPHRTPSRSAGHAPAVRMARSRSLLARVAGKVDEAPDSPTFGLVLVGRFGSLSDQRVAVDTFAAAHARKAKLPGGTRLTDWLAAIEEQLGDRRRC